MIDWRPSTWGDEIALEYGKAIRGYQDAVGDYRVYGTNGPVGWTSDYLTAGPGIILGRKGAYRGVNFCTEPFWVIDTAYYVRPLHDQLDMRWLFYAIQHHKLGEIDDGSPIPSTTRAAVYVRDLDVPPLPEQRAIAKCLLVYDDKIDLNLQTNKTLESMARAIFKDWFVDFGPTRRIASGETDPVAILGGLLPDSAQAAAVTSLFPKNLGANGLPEGWEEREIGDLCQIVGGGTPSTKEPIFWEAGTHLWATPKDLSKLTGMFIRETERRITDLGLAKIRSGLSPKGSVLMSSRAPIGYVAIVEKPMAINQGFIAMQPAPALPTEFVYFWTLENLDLIKANANGSTFQEISKKNFRPLKVNHASADVLAKFSKVAGALLEMIRNNEQENQSLTAIQDLLLPKLMSGRLRLEHTEGS
ncbi:restriction endonuclease subunit S [Halomonas sp. M1]|uniref:restriction endonuclease subunit S n=1 Tax=Halomonas sp. M1 TaxID=3035470 RepID=UPI00248674C7|nr:restriction endonuclease subunit S [Halomonas sp. M1]WFE70652.1 restriction endonuclease subunit S [Halomonas sp. M1]